MSSRAPKSSAPSYTAPPICCIGVTMLSTYAMAFFRTTVCNAAATLSAPRSGG
jgi:hypothetical protein